MVKDFEHLLTITSPVCHSKRKAMKYIETSIPDVWVLEPRVFEDARGYFMETWREEDFNQHIGRKVHFCARQPVAFFARRTARITLPEGRTLASKTRQSVTGSCCRRCSGPAKRLPYFREICHSGTERRQQATVVYPKRLLPTDSRFFRQKQYSPIRLTTATRLRQNAPFALTTLPLALNGPSTTRQKYFFPRRTWHTLSASKRLKNFEEDKAPGIGQPQLCRQPAKEAHVIHSPAIPQQSIGHNQS